MAKPKKMEKMDEIHRVIARLFAQKGYHSTSLREIARYLGMNPSSLYHYFGSKEEVLFKLMNEAMDEAMATLEKISRTGLAPEDRLKEVLGYYVRHYAGDRDRLILLVNEMNSLNDRDRRVLLEKQRRYVHLINAILEDLDHRGRLKEIHPAVATFAFFGMVHYTIKWYRKDGPVGLDALARQFVEIFTGGVLEESGRRSAARGRLEET